MHVEPRIRRTRCGPCRCATRGEACTETDSGHSRSSSAFCISTVALTAWKASWKTLNKRSPSRSTTVPVMTQRGVGDYLVVADEDIGIPIS